MIEQTTKERILIAAEELMLEKSFHSVGLKQLLDAVQVPKGSFYHYFESKEQFGAEMLKHYMDAAGDQKRRVLLSKNKQPDPLKRLFLYLDGSITFMNSLPGKFPCLVLKLASEVTDLSEPMRKELARGFEDWIDIFKQLLDEAVDKKLIRENIDTHTEAQLIHDLWNGATQRAVINQSSQPVEHAIEHIKIRFNTLLTP